MKSNAVKIWVGVGAFVLSGATAATPVRSVDAKIDRPSVTQSEIPVEKTANATGFTIAQGGEGGEGGGKPEFVDKLSGAPLVQCAASRWLHYLLPSRSNREGLRGSGERSHGQMRYTTDAQRGRLEAIANDW